MPQVGKETGAREREKRKKREKEGKERDRKEKRRSFPSGLIASLVLPQQVPPFDTNQ
jgi:hypothetical protein